MATQYDEKFMYLRFEHGFSRPQMNDLINRVMEENEEALANSKDRDNLLYDLVVGELSGSTEASSVPNSTETTKEADENSNGKEFDVLVVTHPDVMKNIDGSTYSTYAGLKAISNFDGVTLEEYNNYIQKRGAQKVLLDFMEEASKEFDGKIPASRTVKRHVEKLINNNIPLIKVENYNNKVYYKLLNCIDGKYYVRIPYEKVRELVVSCTPNMMKLYAVMCYATNETEYKPITRSWLTGKIGLSIKSNRGLDEIGTLLTSLCNLGFLDCIEEVSISPDGNEYKTIHKYRITTLDEYREAKRRGKHRKIVKK